MRSFLLFAAFLLMPLGLAAQEPSRSDIVAAYEVLRTNTTPGVCGCFLLNGLQVSTSRRFGPHLAVAAQVSLAHASSTPSGTPLTLDSYLGGFRYHSIPYPNQRRVEPFAEVLLGAAHASGLVAGAGNNSTAFNSRLGGGVDVRLGRLFSVRLFQADWDLSHFANSTNGRQNNLLIASGFVFQLPARGPGPYVPRFHPTTSKSDPFSGVAAHE